MNNPLRKDQPEETKIYLTPDSTLQTESEHRHDQSVDPRKDNNIGVSRDDLNDTDTDRYREQIDGISGNGEEQGS